MATVNYEEDIVAWANEQAWLVRNKKFDLLDLEHIAEEIEDVGKSEQRELASRMAVLLCHLLKWQYQPARQGASWRATIKAQRARIKRRLHKTPSLNSCLTDAEWWADAWDDARDVAEKETGIAYEKFSEQCPWEVENILSETWFPQFFESH
ncbi:MAG: DUF29 domain-containing protein [Methylovulum sp.]|uniref:DUF29 domain-containing protein n=1 Tax=Methylovulum sp. TaxID=1916980 RepID=UPI0026331074|nr:DUF29 domain-containing protein [Methylovulum sp.]MDD2725065.1 DUF29 domain-containing protein [Methylovulum sp.]MDD5125294.1 DUF29 domain-containing protein [Methylovulum sp.]